MSSGEMEYQMRKDGYQDEMNDPEIMKTFLDEAYESVACKVIGGSIKHFETFCRIRECDDLPAKELLDILLNQEDEDTQEIIREMLVVGACYVSERLRQSLESA